MAFRASIFLSVISYIKKLQDSLDRGEVEQVLASYLQNDGLRFRVTQKNFLFKKMIQKLHIKWNRN